MTYAREPFESAHFQYEKRLTLPTQRGYLQQSLADQSRSQSLGLVVDFAPSPPPERPSMGRFRMLRVPVSSAFPDRRQSVRSPYRGASPMPRLPFERQKHQVQHAL